MSLRPILAAAAALILASPALSQTAPLVRGTIEKVDTATSRLSIHHESIPNLEMDGGMTMIFRVGDPAMLQRVKVGEKVRFTAERVNGQITVTRIEPAK